MAKTDKPRGIQRRAQGETRLNPDAFINAAQGGVETEGPFDALAPAPIKHRGARVTFNLRLTAAEHAMLSAVAHATNRSKHDVCMTLLLPALEKAHERFVQEV